MEEIEDTTKREFAYRPPRPPFRFLGGTLAVLGPVIFYLATHDTTDPAGMGSLHRNLAYNEFCGVVIAIGAILAGIFLWKLGGLPNTEGRILLGPHYFRLKSAFSELTVRYTDITALTVTENKGHRILLLTCPKGNVTVSSRELASSDALDEIYHLLMQRTNKEPQLSL